MKREEGRGREEEEERKRGRYLMNRPRQHGGDLLAVAIL